MVGTAAWNCSCAAFAFSAFPAEGGRGTGFPIEESGASSGKGVDEQGLKWEFGGLSFDGKEGHEDGVGPSGRVSCCKHLLACVLAERWSVMGEYVEERMVGREEGAGLIGAI